MARQGSRQCVVASATYQVIPSGVKVMKPREIEIKFLPLVFIPQEPMSEWLYKFRKREACREVASALTKAFYEGLLPLEGS